MKWYNFRLEIQENVHSWRCIISRKGKRNTGISPCHEFQITRYKLISSRSNDRNCELIFHWKFFSIIREIDDRSIIISSSIRSLKWSVVRKNKKNCSHISAFVRNYIWLSFGEPRYRSSLNQSVFSTSKIKLILTKWFSFNSQDTDVGTLRTLFGSSLYANLVFYFIAIIWLTGTLKIPHQPKDSLNISGIWELFQI